jgi:WD repeat-containing protein 26
VDHHHTPVSAASWAPDGLSFVTSALEKASSICHWSVEPSDFGANLHTIGGGFRAQDCAISPDGERLVVVDSEKHLYVFNFHTYEKEYSQAFSARLTCVTVTQDSRHILVNLSTGEIQLLELETGDPVKSFKGQKQGNYIIRSCLGGAAENFVLSGSEGKQATRPFYGCPS